MQRYLAALVMAAACGGKREAAPGDAGVVAVDEPASDAAVAVAAPPVFPAGTRSLRLATTAPVRLTPAEDGKRIGTVAQDTRVGWTRTVDGPGCKKAWVEIEPRGWVCGENLRPSDKAPTGVELPRLDEGGLVPGVYGKVVEAGAVTWQLIEPAAPGAGGKGKGRGGGKGSGSAAGPVTSPDEVDPRASASGSASASADGGRKMIPAEPLLGSVNVRKYAELSLGGKTYWKIDPKKNVYLLASSVRQHAPSAMHGVRLGDDTGITLPIAFVWPRGGALHAWTHGKAVGGGVVRQAAQREAVPVLETATDAGGRATAYRIGAAEWIDAREVRVVQPAPLPVLLEPGERWFDVELDAQTVVAYEGELPVYATLMSSGAGTTPTEKGIYRVWKKVAETDMRGLSAGGEDPYSVATVPWTEFFAPEKGLALHTAYWHDGFGKPRSHGCVNLAPQDARWLYFWSDPWVPPGWTMTAGVVEAPGSIVRVRSASDAEPPPYRGYAIRVQEARAAAAKSGHPAVP